MLASATSQSSAGNIAADKYGPFVAGSSISSNTNALGGGAGGGTIGSVSNEYLTSGYKTALRNFMDKQLERSCKNPYGSGSAANSSIPMSRVFRERQSRRMFDDLTSLKGSCAKTYEELEQMHAEILLGKGAPMRKV